MSPALAPGMHLTMVAGVANATFLTIELPITRVLSSAGMSLSGENLFDGLDFRTMPPLPDSHPATLVSRLLGIC